jgi:hypothetical protein
MCISAAECQPPFDPILAETSTPVEVTDVDTSVDQTHVTITVMECATGSSTVNMFMAVSTAYQMRSAHTTQLRSKHSLKAITTRVHPVHNDRLNGTPPVSTMNMTPWRQRVHAAQEGVNGCFKQPPCTPREAR